MIFEGPQVSIRPFEVGLQLLRVDAAGGGKMVNSRP
jgi:hypothetical protein